LADALVKHWSLKWQKQPGVHVALGRTPTGRAYVIKPQSYMNNSGQILRGNAPDLADLMIMVDDFALPVGHYRLRGNGSAGGHNGMKSIESALGTINYPRLRIGVGPKPKFVDQSEFVLGELSGEEGGIIRALIPEMIEAIELWMSRGIEVAMNQFNRKASEPEAGS
jgi:PTH1 family peptidyl-tRNA hydrolase